MLLHRQRQLTSRTTAAAPSEPPKPTQPTAKQSSNDPRLKWARPEWLKPQHGNIDTVSAAPQAQNSNRTPVLLKPKQQTLLNRVTYGSFSSSDSEDDSGSSYNSSTSSSWEEGGHHAQLYQALGIDFGAQRVGIAVRRSSSNVPLLTLHRQQQQYLQSSSRKCTDAVQPELQQQQPQLQLQQQQASMVSLKRTAAAVLHLALQEGCDGFVVGLPIYNQQQQQQLTGAAAAAAAAQQEERKLNSIIRTFALCLAELAAAMQLPVLLVNEQQSSQQARAVMSGAAGYDIKAVHDLEQQQQQRKASRKERQQQINRIGRDAFAAALILSRYYNGLVQPIEQVMPLKEPSGSSGGSGSGSAAGDSSQDGSSSSSWGKKQQWQAAADLKQMMTSPGEQRRRHKQRELMSIAAAAAAEAEAAREVVIQD